MPSTTIGRVTRPVAFRFASRSVSCWAISLASMALTAASMILSSSAFSLASISPIRFSRSVLLAGGSVGGGGTAPSSQSFGGTAKTNAARGESGKDTNGAPFTFRVVPLIVSHRNMMVAWPCMIGPSAT